MATYNVDVFVEYTGRLQVEAEDEDEAGEKALENLPTHLFLEGARLDLFSENVEVGGVD